MPRRKKHDRPLSCRRGSLTSLCDLRSQCKEPVRGVTARRNLVLPPQICPSVSAEGSLMPLLSARRPPVGGEFITSRSTEGEANAHLRSTRCVRRRGSFVPESPDRGGHGYCGVRGLHWEGAGRRPIRPRRCQAPFGNQLDPVREPLRWLRPGVHVADRGTRLLRQRWHHRLYSPDTEYEPFGRACATCPPCGR